CARSGRIEASGRLRGLQTSRPSGPAGAAAAPLRTPAGADPSSGAHCMSIATDRNESVAQAKRVQKVAEQLCAWGHGHHHHEADEGLIGAFRVLDAEVKCLAGQLGISVQPPVAPLNYWGFTHLPWLAINAKKARRRICIDGRWDD